MRRPLLHSPDEWDTMKLGLDAIRALDRARGYPSRAFPSVHVGGTNGKGSVATKIAVSLELAGKRVGLFTSPHISSVTERIQINRTPISEEDLARLSPPGLTYFETLTLAAFSYFAEKKVDIAVIEVGLGGRLDATNILTPILAVITSVDYDHMDVLGESLEEIAREKAGILKPGVPYVLGPNVPFIEGPHVTPCGDFETENRAIARRACALLGIEPLGIEVTPPCRFQRIGKVILDGAHNVPALKRLLERIERPFTALAAFSKQPEAMVELLAREASALYLTTHACERLLPPQGEGIIEPNFERAFAQAYAQPTPLLITGSFFIMDAAAKAAKKATESVQSSATPVVS